MNVRGKDLLLSGATQTAEETVSRMLFNSLCKIDDLEDQIETRNEWIRKYEKIRKTLSKYSTISKNQYRDKNQIYITVDYIYEDDESFEDIKEFFCLTELKKEELDPKDLPF